MMIRLVILLMLLLVSIVAVYAWRWTAQRRLQQVAMQSLPPAIDALLTAGKPAFLYFTTRECSQCRFRQSPILMQLQQQRGVNVVTVDAAKQHEVANFYGVMTVPSTILIDANSRPIAINHGLATSPQLTQQWSAVAS